MSLFFNFNSPQTLYKDKQSSVWYVICLSILILQLALFSSFGTIQAKENQAKEKKAVLEVLTEDAFTLAYYAPDGIIKGFAVELFHAIMADTGLTYEVTIVPWARTYQKIQHEKNIIVFPMGRTKERQDKFLWPIEIMPIVYSLYGVTKNLPPKPLSLKELKQVAVAVPRSDIRAEYLQKHNFSNLVLTSGNNQLNKLIQYERINYFLSSQIGINQLLEVNKMKKSYFTKIHTFNGLETKLYVAMSIDSDPEIYNEISNSFQNILNNGTYMKIMGPLFDQLDYSPKLHNDNKKN